MNSTSEEPDDKDVFLGMDKNMIILLQTYVLAICAFLIVFASTVGYTFWYHNSHRVGHTKEVSLIKTNLKVLRLLSFLLILLQLPLLSHSTNYPNRKSPYETLIRPVGTLAVIGFGFVVNSHPVFRWIFALGMMYLVAFETTSEVILYEDVKCFSRGISCSGRMPTLQDTTYYIWRDLMAIGLELWCFLINAYLTIAIGCCTSRYSVRMLSTGLPYRNIREILDYHYNEKSKV